MDPTTSKTSERNDEGSTSNSSVETNSQKSGKVEKLPTPKQVTMDTTSTLELEEHKNGAFKSSSTPKKAFKEMTMKERMNYVREIITVEPLVVCYAMATVLCTPALLVLEFEKACRVNEGYDDKICDDIVYKEDTIYINESIKIQIRIANMHSWQQPLQYVMPVILVLFLGSYSDRHKIRKPFLLLPVIGEFLAVLGCMLCVIFMHTWPLEAQGISQTVIPSFFGGPSMLIMSAFAYIADVSTVEMRTLRVGIVQFLLSLSSPIVQSFSGKLFTVIGYLWILLIAAVLFAIGLLYGIFFIKEPKQPVGVVEKKALIRDVFDPKHAIETFNVLVKKKKGNKRLLIVLLMINLFIWAGVSQGELSVFYLFTVTVYKWGPVEYSLFGTINTVVHLIGTAISIPLLSTYLKLSDLLIAVISFLDKVLCNIIFALYLKPTGLYIGTVVSIVTAISSIAIRSQATKIVNADDLGKAQSLFAVTEAIAPAVFTPIYNTGVYNNTIEVFPSAFFLVGAALHFIGSGILAFMYKLAQKKNEMSQNGETNLGYIHENNDSNIIETTYI
ncbi:solute carrier family 46 member 3-like [Agrilus planipennis]|uniref:Solute carrier family 46 member 3-like n=1 Tax=Agrilus planipennis TaxID=224129 RepID=A0A1W4W5X5_AGRPL|nr:solute carrier family 46 member 3-like [Agrilus planipennis]